jgi:hypothetical protein
LIALAHGLFPAVDNLFYAEGCNSQIGDLVVRAGISNWLSASSTAPAGAAYSSASSRRLARKTGVGTIAGEAAATLALFAKVYNFAIGLTRDEAGVPPSRLSVAGA